jgi:hypothetical protein
MRREMGIVSLILSTPVTSDSCWLLPDLWPKLSCIMTLILMICLHDVHAWYQQLPHRRWSCITISTSCHQKQQYILVCTRRQSFAAPMLTHCHYNCIRWTTSQIPADDCCHSLALLLVTITTTTGPASEIKFYRIWLPDYKLTACNTTHMHKQSAVTDSIQVVMFWYTRRPQWYGNITHCVRVSYPSLCLNIGSNQLLESRHFPFSLWYARLQIFIRLLINLLHHPCRLYGDQVFIVFYFFIFNAVTFAQDLTCCNM